MKIIAVAVAVACLEACALSLRLGVERTDDDPPPVAAPAQPDTLAIVSEYQRILDDGCDSGELSRETCERHRLQLLAFLKTSLTDARQAEALQDQADDVEHPRIRLALVGLARRLVARLTGR